MPWWSWGLIWAGALLVPLSLVVGIAFTLFRKLMRTADALQHLGSQLAALHPVPETSDAYAGAQQFHPAVFRDAEELRLTVERAAVVRKHRAQVRRDRRIVHGKLIQHAQ
ncbi:hypothetical protein [Cryobacterium sp. CG_9.6]|uniref:hypothetical protein n=1 Tax=Cryobacterium sp. CG_9.6 TaxID=2760710 RepID=UPI00247618CD|nr:hypothetical protein [Cryobacterium sp. CG_9.6]MDH6236987.1 hypothetical protein [Cryobacterium sp. CG_9.6]